MTINQAAASSPTASTTATSKKAAEDPLGRDAFMKLLLTQLQHQDPTQPQADGEFLAQLAQFSTLEQLQQMNTKLDTIAKFFSEVESAAGSPKE